MPLDIPSDSPQIRPDTGPHIACPSCKLTSGHVIKKAVAGKYFIFTCLFCGAVFDSENRNIFRCRDHGTYYCPTCKKIIPNAKIPVINGEKLCPRHPDKKVLLEELS